MLNSRKMILGLVLVVILTITAFADVPTKLGYQGILKNKSGVALSGSYNMVFSIYNGLSGGSNIWTETHSGVPVTAGLFNVTLGDSVSLPAAVFNGDPKYVGVSIGNDSEMTPRTALLPVLYSLRAGVADSLSSGTVTNSAYSILSATASTAAYSTLTGTASRAAYSVLSGTATTAAYSVLSGTATNAANATTVNGIQASTEAINGKLFPLGVGGKLSGIPVSAEAGGNNYALFVNGGKIGVKTGTNMSVGTGTITSGTASVIISNTSVNSSSIILLSVGADGSDSNSNGGVRISAITAGASFTVKTMDNNSAASNIPFNYLIVN